MMQPVTMPGLHMGSTTLKKVSIGEARRLAATSSGRVPSACMLFIRGCTMNGIEYTTDATTKPVNVKGKLGKPHAAID
jgi:hypothetical protein